MGRFTVDRAALERVPSMPAIDSRVRTLANTIHDEARGNIIRMGAVDTGALRDSGVVDGAESTYMVGFDTDYAAYVHEGTYKMPARSYLAEAALKKRGRLA